MSDNPPSLMFAREWRRILKHQKIMFPNIQNMSRENVVMHVCTENKPQRSFMRVAFGENGRPTGKIQDSITKSGQKLGVYSSSDLDSPFEHLKFNAIESGKLLVFHNKRNIIRAGKHTHADALLSVLKFFHWSNCNNGNWYTGIATPNSVLSGKFKRPPSDKIKNDPYVSFSDRFPGISVNVAHAYQSQGKDVSKQNCSTPVVYESGKFIIPGVKIPNDLFSACVVLNTLGKKYSS